MYMNNRVTVGILHLLHVCIAKHVVVINISAYSHSETLVVVQSRGGGFKMKNTSGL